MFKFLNFSLALSLYFSPDPIDAQLSSSHSASYFKSDTSSLSTGPSILCAEECHALQSASPQTPCALFSASPCRFNAFAGQAFEDKAYPHSCGHIKRVFPDAATGVNEIKLASANISQCQEGYCEKKVFCDMDTDGGGWTMLQRQAEGIEDFNRSLSEYEAGFGNVSRDHWLGLEPLEKILSAMGPSDLLVSARHEGQSCRSRALYRNWRLLDSDGYPFDYDTFDANSSLPDILAVSKGVGRFAVFDDPVRKAESCSESPGYLSADGICSSLRGGGRAYEEVVAACTAVHPLMRPSELSPQEAAHLQVHYGGGCIRVGRTVGRETPYPAGWSGLATPQSLGLGNVAAGDAAADCRAAFVGYRKIVHTCNGCLGMCSYKLSRAGSGGWWWSGVGKAWVQPNNPLRAGCHSWASDDGLPAAWAHNLSAPLRGLAQVSIAVREADFRSTEWSGEDWCSDPMDDCE